MPGSSLWLLPPSDHPLDATLTNLINSTSTRFNSPHLFVPHVTLTVDINPATYATEPQAWLNSLILPDRGNVKVQLGELQSDDFFFKKLYFNVGKHGVGDLAKVARMKVNGFEEEETANMWVEKEYKPHLSLL
ncbi:2, 3 cyclic phosphodiesterase [Pleomassaria siparia CBS 279.74]|uniref:2, 3 cyclic phosphodiesterase n=1 Tax=Pleomassaria siparia CBS 279.74 TaxID=1314801 RepID=A0A6G1K276_9PLEO|nr:2, 3 cyclic phosphodiesterase [Pleomassaria siparia CBS 279.74]